MKSARVHSYDSQSKSIKKRYSAPKKDISFNGKPTPLDFDSFIPWFCLELQVSRNIIVTRTNQAEYVSYEAKSTKLISEKSSKTKSRSTKTKLALSTVNSGIESKRISVPRISYATSTVDITDAIPVTTCYDKLGRLVEIAIIGCPFDIPQKVIQAFNLCLPFHPRLFKLSIRKGGVCPIILYEISKLLPHSNITEICLDDSRVPGDDYSILLDRPAQVKYLSLKRCNINDEGCKKIAAKIDLNGTALKTLLVLDLTSNNIMDAGAQALGETLKYNRYLLHLNLSGNRITDAGASSILKYLQDFLLTFDDIKEKRRRRMEYLKCKFIIYEKCLEEVKLARAESEPKKEINRSSDQIINALQHNRRKKTKKHVTSLTAVNEHIETTVEQDAERKATEILGEFEDPFAEQYIIRKDNILYAVGNLTLTSLNLAYNNLSFLSVRKILNVLRYQSEIIKFPFNTGLVRVAVDGNNIPNQCHELHEIDLYLKRARLENEYSDSSTGNFTHFKRDLRE